VMPYTSSPPKDDVELAEDMSRLCEATCLYRYSGNDGCKGAHAAQRHLHTDIGRYNTPAI
jgi:hypothetical protein